MQRLKLWRLSNFFTIYPETRNYFRSYSREAYPKHGTCKDLSQVPLMARTEFKHAFPSFLQCLKHDHGNNLPAFFELIEDNCPSTLSLCLTTFDWSPPSKKLKELQEKQHGYSRKKPSITAGKDQVNKPILSERYSPLNRLLHLLERGRPRPLHVLSHRDRRTTDKLYFQTIMMQYATPQTWVFCPRKTMKLLIAASICNTILQLCQLYPGCHPIRPATSFWAQSKWQSFITAVVAQNIQVLVLFSITLTYSNRNNPWRKKHGYTWGRAARGGEQCSSPIPSNI